MTRVHRETTIHCRDVGPDLSGDNRGNGVKEIGAALSWGRERSPFSIVAMTRVNSFLARAANEHQQQTERRCKYFGKEFNGFKLT
jgi:hypothetical protein